MNTKLQDTIERVLVLKASIQRVYHAISSAEGLVKWFPNRIEGKVEPGETAQISRQLVPDRDEPETVASPSGPRSTARPRTSGIVARY